MKGHFDSILELHTREIIPHVYTMKSHKAIQMPLFRIRLANKFHMGFFFELLSAGLFGGKLIDSVTELPEDSPYDIKPDVESVDKIIESKCIVNGSHLNLYDDQIGKYKVYQTMKPDKQISFAIWRHSLRATGVHRGSIAELLMAITERLQAGIVLPLSIMTKLWENDTKISRKYGEPWCCVSVKSPVINNFIFNPWAMVERLHLNPEDYRITRYISPQNFIVDKISVKQFPLIIIEDRYPAKWIE